MQRAVTRVLRGVVLSVLTVLTALASASSPASAADQDLGWIRLQPATGTTDIAVLALTQSRCPGGDAVIVTLRGPNIEATNRIGNLVGVTEYKAFDPTMSGQLWIPLSFTFQQWFAVNGVTLVPKKPYTITVVCRDLLRSSKTYGTYSGQVVFDGKGGYEALGDASKPFNTQLKPKDPNGVPVPFPIGSGSPSSSPSSPAATESPSAADSAPTQSPSEPPTPDVTVPAPQDPPSEAASPSTTGTSTGGSGPVLLGGLAALAAVGGAWTLYSRRRGAGASSTGGTDTP